MIIEWIDARKERPPNDTYILFVERGMPTESGVYYEGPPRVEYNLYFDSIPWDDIVWWLLLPEAPVAAANYVEAT